MHLPIKDGWVPPPAGVGEIVRTMVFAVLALSLAGRALRAVLGECPDPASVAVKVQRAALQLGRVRVVHRARLAVVLLLVEPCVDASNSVCMQRGGPQEHLTTAFVSAALVRMPCNRATRRLSTPESRAHARVTRGSVTVQIRSLRHGNSDGTNVGDVPQTSMPSCAIHFTILYCSLMNSRSSSKDKAVSAASSS